MDGVSSIEETATMRVCIRDYKIILFDLYQHSYARREVREGRAPGYRDGYLSSTYKFQRAIRDEETQRWNASILCACSVASEVDGHEILSAAVTLKVFCCTSVVCCSPDSNSPGISARSFSPRACCSARRQGAFLATSRNAKRGVHSHIIHGRIAATIQ